MSWVWAFKTGDSRKWIVISANPRGDRAFVVKDADVPESVRSSKRRKVGYASLEIWLYERALGLAKSRKLSMGKKFHVGEMDLEAIVGGGRLEGDRPGMASVVGASGDRGANLRRTADGAVRDAVARLHRQNEEGDSGGEVPDLDWGSWGSSPAADVRRAAHRTDQGVEGVT